MVIMITKHPKALVIMFLYMTIIPIATGLNFSNVMELSQFGSTVALSKFNNPTQVEPNQSYLQMCLLFQNIECITNVNWPVRNLLRNHVLTFLPPLGFKLLIASFK